MVLQTITMTMDKMELQTFVLVLLLTGISVQVDYMFPTAVLLQTQRCGRAVRLEVPGPAADVRWPLRGGRQTLQRAVRRPGQLQGGQVQTGQEEDDLQATKTYFYFLVLIVSNYIFQDPEQVSGNENSFFGKSLGPIVGVASALIVLITLVIVTVLGCKKR